MLWCSPLPKASNYLEDVMPPVTGLNQKNVEALTRAASKLTNPSLSSKIRWLQNHKSNDPLQQMQTDAIVDLFEAVKQIQEAIWPMLATIPDVGAVRDAAAQTTTTGAPATALNSSTSRLTNIKLR
jgi:hypothetical protein